MTQSGRFSVRIVLVTVVILLSVMVPTVAVGETANGETAVASDTEPTASDTGATDATVALCGGQVSDEAVLRAEAVRANAAAFAGNASFAQNGSNFTAGSSSITTVELPGSVLVVYTRRPPQNQAGRIYRRVISISKESFSCPAKGKVGICREVFRRRETVRTGRNRIVTNYYAVQCQCRFRPRGQSNDSRDARRPLVA